MPSDSGGGGRRSKRPDDTEEIHGDSPKGGEEIHPHPHEGGADSGTPDMTRERARTERRDLDKERGEPVAGGAARGGPRALRPTAGPLHDWSTRPKILITNDDGVES